jgi:hypothetical protein
MRFRSLAIFAWLIVQLGLTGPAHAAPTVQVLETHPPGDSITLPRNQSFHLRLAYSSATPVGIWIAPYFQGKRVNAGSSPSQRHSGEGETMAWFFFMKPGDEVDEIRITAGDGGTQTTPLVATHRVRIVGSSEPALDDTAPAWVAQFRERARLAQQEADAARTSTPVSAGERVFFGGFMLAMLALGVVGFVAPLWMIRRWQGGWRIAAAVPAVMMGFVVLRIVVGVAVDPTSHNLWPFEILMAGALSAGAIGVLVVARRFTGARSAS